MLTNLFADFAFQRNRLLNFESSQNLNGKTSRIIGVIKFYIHVQCNAQLKKADKSVDEQLPQNISSKNVLLAFAHNLHFFREI